MNVIKSIRYISVVILLLAGLTIEARTISGMVFIESDSTAAPGVTCRLFRGTTLLATVQTDGTGAFGLSTDEQSELLLELTLTGMASTEVQIAGGSKNIDLGNLYLYDGVQLDEVTVTAATRIDSRGRIITYPSQANIKASSTSLSLFQKLPLPGLHVDPMSRSITVDGGTPMILINGVPSTIYDLQALLPKNIEKIEYARITPARYADKGVSGLINITLKKRDDGGQIYFWERSAIQTAFVDGNDKFSYHQGPSQFSIIYNHSWRNYQKCYDRSTSSYISDGMRVDLSSEDRNPFNYFSNRLRARYDYSPDVRTLLSVTFNTNPFTSGRRVIGKTFDSVAGQYDNLDKNSSRAFTPSLDIFFRRDFNEKNSIEAEVVGTLNTDRYRSSHTFVYSDGSIAEYVNNADSRRRSLISEISYIHSFNDRTSLSTGAQNTTSHSTNKYLTTEYKPVLTENNNYIYARLGQQISTVYLSLSTGAKMYWVKNDRNKRNFIRNISKIQANWHISDKWNVNAYINYSPGLPGLSALTDYAQQVSPYLISNGNPDLKVAEYFNYSASANYQRNNLWISLYTYISDARHSFIDDVRYIGDGLFLSQTVNCRSNRSYKAFLSGGISDLYGFGINASMGVQHYTNEGENWSHSLTSLSGNLNLWWSKGPWVISYWRKFPGKYLYGHSVGKDENWDGLSVEYAAGKHWKFDLSWMYMFDKKGSQYPTWDYSPVNPGQCERHISNNANMIVLALSYSTDFGKIFKTGRRTLNNSDDVSSLMKN